MWCVFAFRPPCLRGRLQGNKAAVFPLQLLGIETDAVNSVQFSNHTGYGSVRGDVLGGEQLRALLDGLSANGLLADAYSHLLTGYIGSLSFLRAVVGCAESLRASNPGLLYLCDPVLGDAGKLYVPPELVAAYRDELLPLAQWLTPNWFEAELLTGLQCRSVEQALAACNALHARGPHTVFITSVETGEEEVTLVASTRVPQAEGSPSRFLLRLPRLPGYFTGAGDLCAALLLARSSENPGRLAAAVELAVASVQAVLQRTAAFAAAPGAPSGPAARELQLVQSVAELMNPTVEHRVEALPDVVAAAAAVR